MNTTGDIHPIQTEILRTLLFQPTARFSALNTTGVTSDHFAFHVKKLTDSGLIEKTGAGSYQLTIAGKEFANRLDTDAPKITIERQAKIGVLIVCIRQKDGATEYLIQQRLKQPYYGYHGFMTGKAKWGEKIEDTATRELEEETGLTGTLTLAGIKHKMDYSAEGALLEDKYFFVFRGADTHGALRESFEGGRNLWVRYEDIARLPNQFDGVQGSIDMVTSEALTFVEKQYTVSGF